MKKEYIKAFLKVVISVLLIYLLLRKIDLNLLKDNLTNVPLATFILSFVFFSLTVIIGALKWGLLLQGVSKWTLIKTMFKAKFFSTVLPGQLFGEASKVAVLHKENKSDIEITSSVVVDKIIGLVAVSLLGMIGVVFTNANLSISFKLLFVTMFFMLSLILLFPRIRLLDQLFSVILNKLEVSNRRVLCKVGNLGYIFYSTWKQYAKDLKRLSVCMLLGLIVQSLGVIQEYSIGAGLELGISFYEFCWIYAILSLLLLLPISFAGLGVREVSLVGFLGLFGVSSENALTLSVVMLSSQLVGALLGGIFILVEQISDYRNNK